MSSSVSLQTLERSSPRRRPRLSCRSCASPRTRRASWSSNLSLRECAPLRSKFLPCSPADTVLCCTVQYNGTLHYSTVQYKSNWVNSKVLLLTFLRVDIEILPSASTIKYNKVL